MSVCRVAAVVLLCMGLAACSGASGPAGIQRTPDLNPVPAAPSVPESRVQPAAGPAETTGTEFDDAFFEDYDEEQEVAIADPLEPWNRFWFGFNDILLLKVVKPVYSAYEAVTPQALRTGLSNALHNIKTPIRIANRILQGEFAQAWVELGRFIVNSTIGFGGLIDVAKKDKPLVPMTEGTADFGTTLGKWGIGEGIYLVWPFFGPSTARDTVGMGGDYAASPFFWLVEPTGKAVEFWPGLGTSLGLRFNDFGGTLETYETLTKSAVEPYTAARDAYVKYRRSLLQKVPQ